MKTEEFDFLVQVAPREYKRLFYSGVVKSFPKTVTEPVTNSDTSYERKFSLPHSSGLVAKALSFRKGIKFDLSDAKKELLGKAPERIIEVHIYTSARHGHKPKTCQIVDFAEGLSPEDLRNAFQELAADKSGVSKGRPGRSLFGRGVSDVLLGHENGMFSSYREGILSKASFSFNHLIDKIPKVHVEAIAKPSKVDLEVLHLRPGENGSCVSFEIHEDCHIPEEGSIIPKLAQFYMLRLINADPNVNVKVFRYRSGGKIYEDRLEYDFPIGDVIENFSLTLPEPVPSAGLPPLQIDGIVCRADIQGELPGKEAREQQANGLLIVDDEDSVLDLTLLPKFNGAPYLANVFGVIRIKNVRKVFDWYLNGGKDSPLTITRDGFDERHDFTQLLFRELGKYLEPIYKREEERFNKKYSQNLSSETRQRISEVLKELNKFLKDMGEGEGEDDTEKPLAIDFAKPLQFLPGKTRLTLSKSRSVKLYFKKELANLKGTVILDSSNDKVEVKPLSVPVSDGKERSFSDEKENVAFLIYDILLKCDNLHENASIPALAEAKPGEEPAVYEAALEVSDVVAETKTVPPDEMEFRPKESKGQPNHKNNIALYLNSDVIPIGRKIKLELQKQHGAIGLLEGSKSVVALTITFGKSHLISGTRIGRILIPWRGTGWGQLARVVAETKKPGGSITHAEGRIIIEQEEDTGGMIKDVKYGPLENEKCSDLVNGVIYINSNHFLNCAVFGTEKEYTENLKNDKTAQYRFSSLVLEQAVFRLAEKGYLDNKLALNQAAPVTSLRAFIDEKTHQYAPKVLRAFMTK